MCSRITIVLHIFTQWEYLLYKSLCEFLSQTTELVSMCSRITIVLYIFTQWEYLLYKSLCEFLPQTTEFVSMCSRITIVLPIFTQWEYLLNKSLCEFLSQTRDRVFSQHFGNMTRPLELGIFASFYTKLGKNTPYNKNKISSIVRFLGKELTYFTTIAPLCCTVVQPVVSTFIFWWHKQSLVWN